jgi:hypothetical protein
LSASARNAKPRHHLVKNQQRAVLPRDFTEEFQVSRLRHVQSGVAGHGLQNNRSDLTRIGVERRFNFLAVVERHHDRVLRKCRGHSGAVRIAEGQRA